MRERGDILMGLLVGFLLVFPLGYLVHVSPRFPGSLVGGLTGIAATVLMLLTLPYVAVKHVKWIERALTRYISKPTLLAIHAYSGVLAPIFGLVHAAHKFESPLGVMLTGVLLLTVLSGFIGRYLLGQIARALRGRRSELASLQSAFLNLPAPPPDLASEVPVSGWKRYFFVSGSIPAPTSSERKEVLAAALADTEFAIRAEEATNALFAKWRLLHIVLGSIVYGLLVVHIGAAIYFGLRWL
ncbi:MAG: hypothetical protein KKD64_11090 [Alphaproteobacteria bacterium]|jgi:hypothetical protein|uniref:hypothetical protein n=1 Tax=Sphingomonadales TaxID=204457 RepID=UPI0002489C33|nr:MULTISPECIES: hypothetical protein [Sphingomonadales]MBU0555409.1 hypothetical protein [Alphaproteobacteria bacterium]ARS28232.1 membrane protein [Sphingomonas sp. KC8]MBA4759924.1 hypothetical protein [Sphingosinicella sp.]MBU0793067.1 hypothetical protein [Alphaproteobacteria bacterium]MBU0877675.1 hypothetical protein [Alphaproteobacteria bacterium]|tara:strand:+ start:61683 stop:62408 length:726 start_codon:yes stop_codon:yes gene_type:complete